MKYKLALLFSFLPLCALEYDFEGRIGSYFSGKSSEVGESAGPFRLLLSTEMGVNAKYDDFLFGSSLAFAYRPISDESGLLPALVPFSRYFGVELPSLYAAYSNDIFSIVIGRYALQNDSFDIPSTYFLGANIQGASLKIGSDEFNFWFSYINSLSDIDYFGGRVGADFNSFGSYSASRSELEGETFLLGLSGFQVFDLPFDFSSQGSLKSQIWFMFNSAKEDLLYQIGATNLALFKLGSDPEIERAYQMVFDTSLVFQSDRSKESSLALKLESFVKYNRYRGYDESAFKDFDIDLGVGFFSSNGIFALNDSLRFYGKYVGANYYEGSIAYLFSEFNDDGLRIHFLSGYGSYIELSLASSYEIYKSPELSFGIGGGYIYAGLPSTQNRSHGVFIFSGIHF